jgi:hypothetical protein
MRRALKIALAGAAIALGTAATPAAAVTLQQCTSGASCVSDTTNVNLGTYDAPGSLLVTGTVGVGGPTVNFTSTNGLLETNTGAATIFTASGDLLSQLTFTLLTGSFTAAEFNLENGNIKAMDVVLTTSAGDTKTISISNANGSNIFDIIAGAGESFTSASFQTTVPNGFVDFKQLRLVLAGGTAPVPEPATWGMMLLGFAGIGMAMRRRRSGSALMQIA